MRLKSYFAGSVESAMRAARQELGEDAMLMNSRPSPPEMRHLGGYEVVFATMGKAPASSFPQGGSPPRTATIDPPRASRDLTAEVALMRRELERMSLALERANTRTPGCFHPWIEEVYAELVQASLDPDIAFAIARRLDARSLALNPDDTREALLAEISQHFSVAPSLGKGQGGARKIAAFIGPPGVGKTTALVKLAVQQGVAARRPTQILSVDTQRVGGSEQLRTFSTILGVALQIFQTVGALGQALEQSGRHQLTLIDTPGLGNAEMAQNADLARFLEAQPEVDTHLVLSCSMQSTDLTRVADRFAAFGPAKLLFTRLDETQSYGSIVTQAFRMGLPVSFLTTGQRIPDDLEAASRNRIVELVLRAGAREPRGTWTNPAARTARL